MKMNIIENPPDSAGKNYTASGKSRKHEDIAIFEIAPICQNSFDQSAVCGNAFA